MYEHFRADNSTYHVVLYNETDGSVIRKYTAQGYADWSTWSSGQAWAVHGFTIAYRYTKYQPFLDKAIGAANYFLSRLTSATDLVPYWDFDAPGIRLSPINLEIHQLLLFLLVVLLNYHNMSVMLL